MVLQPEDVVLEFRGEQKRYTPQMNLEGVRLFPLKRWVDDRGLFLELYRREATHAGTEELARFFSKLELAQLNYSLVTVADHIKGLHYHLRQADVWFCPPPFKIKVVLVDLRKNSPTAGQTQVVVLGEGRDAWLYIPEGVAHGYRPLTNPCGLFYLVTRCFDLQNPDEFRIPWDHPKVRDLWDVKNE
ncbi:MAG: dTDP-4-dehydrorhamnose 3,5-epimerase family protein [Thermoanaerobaculaceae bacterium]